jgi:hypothetical protein
VDGAAPTACSSVTLSTKTPTTATCAVTFTKGGVSHVLKAVYSGNGSFTGSTSAPVTETINT